jgi:hypothetical protein
VDAGLLGVELEAHGQIASTVGKTRRKPSKRPQSRENPARSFRIVKFGGFLNLKSDRLLAGFELSWLIETSPGNHQGGIILAEPVTDGRGAVRLLNAVITLVFAIRAQPAH